MALAEAEGLMRLPKELLRPLLLLLLGESKSDYGYALAERLRSLGAEIGDASIVYGALRRLERAGLTTSTIEMPPRGPARRIYRLTPAGIEARAEWAACLVDIQAWLAGASPEARADRPPAALEPELSG